MFMVRNVGAIAIFECHATKVRTATHGTDFVALFHSEVMLYVDHSLGK